MSRYSISITNRPDRTSPEPMILYDVTRRAHNLEFGTALPGGFMSASMSIMLSKHIAVDWYDRLLLYGLRIDEGGDDIWSGRIESIRLKDYGLDIECSGFWASLVDQNLYSWWADNDMSHWAVPVQGAGGISNEISLGALWPELYQLDISNGLFRIGTKKNAIYKNAVLPIGGFYYRLPRISNLADRSAFQPMTIHSIQFNFDRTHSTTQIFTIQVLVADFAKGTWTGVVSSDAGSYALGVHDVNLAAHGADIEAVFVGIKKYNSGADLTETLEDGERRYLFTDVTLYCERDGSTTGKITSDKIVKDLLFGNSNIDVTAHAPMVALDKTMISPTNLEIVPAVFDNMTLQDIVGKMSEYGTERTVNLIKNPSLETNTAGWGLVGAATTLTRNSGTPEPISGDWTGKVTMSGAAGDGISVIDPDGTNRIPVDANLFYFLAMYLESSIAGVQGRFEVECYDALTGGSFLAVQVSSTESIGNGDFVRVDMTVGKLVSGTVAVRILWTQVGATAGHSLYWDAAQFAASNRPLSYSDGDSSDAIWAGTAHASETLRVYPINVGVFGRRRFKMFEIDPRDVKWMVSLKDLGDAGPELERSAEDFYTAAWTRYQEPFTGLTKFSSRSQAWIESQTIYSGRQHVVEAGNVPRIAADKIQKLSLEQHKRPRQKAQFTLSGYVRNAFGCREPVYRIRAGDLLYVQDMLPIYTNMMGEYSKLDSLRTFLVRETKYDADTDTVVVTPDAPPNRLDLLVAQFDIIPSLSAKKPIQYSNL